MIDKRRVVDYQILFWAYGYGQEGQRIVREALADGWQPLGPPYPALVLGPDHPPGTEQAMVKYEEEGER
jgi:hypothetical protein